MKQILKINYEPCRDCMLESNDKCHYFVKGEDSRCLYRNQLEINTQIDQIIS